MLRTITVKIAVPAEMKVHELPTPEQASVPSQSPEQPARISCAATLPFYFPLLRSPHCHTDHDGNDDHHSGSYCTRHNHNRSRPDEPLETL